ncbi:MULTISPECIES: hypothetical protein [Methylobacterium]|uniref:Uncharacterized protein n=1 Tax=Methylobacterium jeotgali TaxID=381630 RepID=A0ABQ4SYC7_9HYPH|nr:MULTISPECIES: hypothetical protein [Methylobacterium]PIU06235.1 MAG: hypothetical protein COT56_10440 [Methylobacterium sp. CG09_land_8_20_14_0_10_71_15]PIU14526.1 MAG: hypothetical protein COT28_07705 [Methylobacterium sp. CG08_land_8_20_14_0_20_71_15]GBU19349.1 hypothetical protein AwMethylo_35640 [Methylobacterium sp.]GJE07495.1 hypothetical protein AOPFMNJM_2824 [Methylobacterium jeotgali]
MVAHLLSRDDGEAAALSHRLDLLEQVLDSAIELRALVDMTGIASLQLLAEMMLREASREIDAAV